MNYHRSRPSRSIQYEREMSTATQPSSLGLTTTRTTQEQQARLGNAATFASNAASWQHDRYNGPSPQSQGLSAAKPSADRLERMEYDLLGAGSHTFASGNIQDGPHASYLELFGCPHHCRVSQEGLTSLGSRQGLSPMERLRTEGTSERYAILPRPDIGDTSMYRCSQCKKMIQGRTGVSEDRKRA